MPRLQTIEESQKENSLLFLAGEVSGPFRHPLA
jgi:hypothetical protein